MPPIFDVSNIRVGSQAIQAIYMGSALIAGGFSAHSIVLEGDNYALRSTALTGVVNSPTGAMSFIFKPTTETTSFRNVFSVATTRVLVQLDSSKRLRVTVGNGTSSFVFRTLSEVLTTDTESHFAISWNTNAGIGAKTGVIMRNGVLDVEVTSDTAEAFTPTLTTQPSIGATAAGANPCFGTLKELMCWLGESIDWTNPANLSKVYSNNAPVNPGNNGQLVTGNTPAVYLSLRSQDLASTFLINRGTGGNFDQAAGTPTIRADEAFIPYGDSIDFGTGSTTFPSDTWVFKTTRGLNKPRRRFNYGVGGEGISLIAARFIAAIGSHVATYPKAVYSLGGGYNSLGQTTAYILGYAQNMVDALLAADPNAKFIFHGIPNGHLTAEGIGTERYDRLIEVNAGLETMVGASRFLNLHTELINNGLAAAGLTATPDDTTDIANGIVPRSLRDPDGSVHHNNFGQTAVSVFVKAKLQALGWD